MKRIAVIVITLVVLAAGAYTSYAWTSTSVRDDPLVRMPGTQPDNGVSLESPNRCLNCHAGYNDAVEPGHNWQGSMMAQAARDFLFWSAMTVAAQDSVWALGNPNATDLCLRCHFPEGWLEGRSDPTNASAMIGSDYDGVQCDLCHSMYDPFFETTHDGSREGGDWLAYWDETNASSTPSQPAADLTHQEDASLAQSIINFAGTPFFVGDQPPSTYTENASGQFFVSGDGAKRASFADAEARHQMFYSRYHKSKYFCSACHDVSNPALANLNADPTQPLPSELNSAFSYFHVERTFSEFMLSDYGQQGGALGVGPFSPGIYETSDPYNRIAMCQDCHMRDVVGEGANKRGVPIRPNDSTEHPESGQPLHDLTGGNVWVSSVLASAIPGSPNYDPLNDQLLNQGAAVLTLDLSLGQGVDPVALLDGADRAGQQLALAASINALDYDPATGALSFQVQNQTGHKLPSGFPEGRRIFVNVKVHKDGGLVHEVNPYDSTFGTLKGIRDDLPLEANEVYVDELVYEMHPSSSLTGEPETLHFVLADDRYKDNRIPPKGFDIANAGARQAQPRWHGEDALDYFTANEYAGGYDAISLTVPAGADYIEVNLYYQTTSREYIEFLRDEINGTATTLPGNGAGGDPPYIIQTDPFFDQLRAWGDAIWQLWAHNMDVPGAAPFLMTGTTFGGGSVCDPPVPTLLSAIPGNQQVSLTWSDEHSSDAFVTGYSLYYNQAGKAQLVADLGLETSYVDTNLTNGQEYCYMVTTQYTGCESGFSNVVCAIPNNPGQTRAGVSDLATGRYETTGKGKNKVTVFVLTDAFVQGDVVFFQATVVDASTGLPIANASVDLSISGPESTSLTSGPSGADGVAEASWVTEAPNRKGQGGTQIGSYTVTVTGVTADGYTWDGTETTTTFTISSP